MTPETINTLSGSFLDGLIDDHVWGVERRATTPQSRRMAIRSAMEEHQAGGPAIFDFGSGPIALLCTNAGAAALSVHVEDREHWVWACRAYFSHSTKQEIEKYVEDWRLPPGEQWSQAILPSWKVVGIMREKEFFMHELHERDRDTWYACFWDRNQDYDPNFYSAYGQHPPEAICRAALKAMVGASGVDAMGQGSDLVRWGDV